MIVLEEGSNKTSLIPRTKVWWDVWSVICYYTLSLAASFNDINFDIIFILQLIHDQEDSTCPLCSQGAEDVLHSLWSCPALTRVWEDDP